VYKRIEAELTYEDKMKLRSKATVLCNFKDLTPRSWLGLTKIVINYKYKNGDLKKGTRLVKKVMEMENSDEWIDAFLPYKKIIDLSMAKATSHHIVNYIFKSLNRLKNYYDENSMSNKIVELHKWLADNAFEIDRYGHDRLKFRKIVKHCNTIMNEMDKYSGRWIEGDCLKHIQTIDDNSISLLLTDPPYGCTYRSISNTTNRTIANDNPEDATRLLKNSLELLWPKMKKNSCVIIFCHDTMLHKFGTIIENVGFKIKNVLTWEKSHHTQGDLIYGFRPNSEKMIYAIKGHSDLYASYSDVFHYPNASNEFHQTQKPEALLSDLIQATTVEHDLVVDCFAGSGSTVVQAKAMGRNWWGCVLDPVDYQHGYIRLNEELPEAA
jgi:site-specific DNA-methyltransferase (adenine-specific)